MQWTGADPVADTGSHSPGISAMRTCWCQRLLPPPPGRVLGGPWGRESAWKIESIGVPTVFVCCREHWHVPLIDTAKNAGFRHGSAPEGCFR